MLKITHLNVFYGPIPALLDASINVSDGKIVAVLGANGAGKSSLLRAISGIARDVQGHVEFDGQNILRKGMGQAKHRGRHLSASRIVRLGVVQVPEGRQLFPQLSVYENLVLGAFTRSGKELRSGLEQAFAYFPLLATKRSRQASTLSGGEQQMLAIARALMAKPKLLMLDEPSIGLSPLLVEEVFEIIRTISREQKCSVLLVEQNVNAALDIADHGYVLETPGHVVLDGTVRELRENEAIRKAYLGETG